MRKLLFIAALFIGALSANAQYRDVKLPEAPKHPGYRDYDSEKSGFWCAFEADGGCSVMEDTPNMPYASVTFTGGYMVNEFLRIGAGLGGKMYLNHHEIRNTSSKFSVPVFANVRGNFMSAYDRDGVPFWSVNIGGITREGLFFNPTIGYSFGGVRDNFLIGLSYTLSTFKDCKDRNLAYSYFGLKLGYQF